MVNRISVIFLNNGEMSNVSKSLNSLLNQSLDDFEVIFLNFKSQNFDYDVLLNYQNKFKSFKILDLPNLELPYAKNNAINKSNGEYVAFLNSGDVLLDNDAFLKMYDVALQENVNLVSANVKYINPNFDILKDYNLREYFEDEVISAKDYGIPYHYFKNIYKKTFLIDNDLFFPDLLVGGDAVFLANSLTNIDNIHVVAVDYYGLNYSKRNQYSEITDFQSKLNYISHFKQIFTILDNAKYKQIKNLYLQELFSFLNFKENSNDKELEFIVNKIFRDDYIMLNNTNTFFNMGDIKISVIVPVYNAEEFIDESLSSVLNQTFKDFEVVCVNDGSKDKSLDLLKSYAKMDSRVKVFDKDNGGCGSARNMSLDNAHGEYIYFFDPDDYLLPDAFEKLYDNAISNDSDLVMFKIARFRDGEEIDYSIPGFDFDNLFPNVDFNNFSFNYKDIKNYVLNASFAPWSKLYKKEFLDKYGDFRFVTGLAFDDVPFHVQSLLRASKISFVPEFFYHYRLSNPNSVNNTSSNSVDIIDICGIVKDFLINNGYFDEFKNEFMSFFITQLLFYIISSNYEEFYHRVKSEFINIDLQDFVISKKLKQEYQKVLDSKSYEDYRLLVGVDVKL